MAQTEQKGWYMLSFVEKLSVLTSFVLNNDRKYMRWEVLFDTIRSEIDLIWQTLLEAAGT